MMARMGCCSGRHFFPARAAMQGDPNLPPNVMVGVAGHPLSGVKIAPGEEYLIQYEHNGEGNEKLCGGIHEPSIPLSTIRITLS
jgi:hypothetical protein